MALALRTATALVDLDVPAPTASLYLRRNAGDTAYEWATAGAASLALDDLTDVAVSSPATGQVVRYSGSAWVNARLNFRDLVGLPPRHTHVPSDIVGLQPASNGAAILAAQVFG